MLPTLLRTLAADLASRTVEAGFNQAVDATFGTDEQRALRRIYNQAYAHMLIEAAGDASDDLQHLLDSLMRDFIAQDDRAVALFDLVVRREQAPVDDLRDAFNALGYDAEQIDFDQLLDALLEGIDMAVEDETSRADSGLFNRLVVMRLSALMDLNQEIRTLVESTLLDAFATSPRFAQEIAAKTGINVQGNVEGNLNVAGRDIIQQYMFLLPDEDMQQRIDKMLIAQQQAANPTPQIDWPDNLSPFPGLKAFTPQYQPLFFGREKETNELVALVKSTPFVIVIGASGSGKSSLVAAGVVPTLEEQTDWLLPRYDEYGWRGLRLTPGEGSGRPLHTMAQRLSPLVHMEADKLTTVMADNPGQLADLLDGLSRTLLVYIDQFEELFTLVKDGEQQRKFVHALMAMSLSDRVHIVATMRSDFAGQLAEYPALNHLIDLNEHSTFYLSRPTKSSLYQMITQPALATGYTYEDDLDWRVLEDTGSEPGALALTAYALEQLWQAAFERGESLLRMDDYEAMGDPERGIGPIEGAIATQADRAYDRIDDLGAAEKERALRYVFAQLVSVTRREDGGYTATRRRAELDTLWEDGTSPEERLISELSDARLLVTDHDPETGKMLLEVAHEALLRTWPRLTQWIAETGDALRQLAEVKRDAKRWKDEGYDPDFLWQHGQMQPVLESLANHPALRRQLTQVERDFLTPEQDRLLAELNTDISHVRRSEIGIRLAQIGDNRPGVGLTQDALPDILWLLVDVPDEQYPNLLPFYIAKYPVTVAQYNAFLKANRSDPYDKKLRDEMMVTEGRSATENNPRDNLDIQDCWAFARWMNKVLKGLELPLPSQRMKSFKVGKNALVRLPREREWEWAATNGAENRIYPWGDIWDEHCANTRESGLARPISVGMYPQGAAACGALDMSGNILEWCDPSKSKYKSFRGGSFYFDHRSATSTYNKYPVPDSLFDRLDNLRVSSWYDNLGVRLVIGVDPKYIDSHVTSTQKLGTDLFDRLQKHWNDGD